MTPAAPEPAFTVEGNRLRLIADGPERLGALLALIAGAQTSLRLLYYIYLPDRAGTAVRDALIAAAARGVKVTLILDGMGAEPATQRDFFAPLTAAGVALCRFVPRIGRKYLLRNHQKLALADEARAIIGGFNISDDYFLTVEQQGWRDLALCVDGPAAGKLADYFDRLARWSGHRKAPVRALVRLLGEASEEHGQVRWLMGGPARRLSPWARLVRLGLKKARRVDLIAAYFAPGPAFLLRLGRAARHGRVRIVLPALADHMPAVWAQRFTYAGLIRRGARIFEYQPTKMHTKLLILDNAVHLGSANFDFRGLFFNLEIMLRIEDADFAAYMRRFVDGEIAQSLAITDTDYRAHTGWWQRLRQAAAYFVMSVVDPVVSRRIVLAGERAAGRLRPRKRP